MATASQSLFNMTVASDNAGGNQGLLMPIVQDQTSHLKKLH